MLYFTLSLCSTPFPENIEEETYYSSLSIDELRNSKKICSCVTSELYPFSIMISNFIEEDDEIEFRTFNFSSMSTADQDGIVASYFLNDIEKLSKNKKKFDLGEDFVDPLNVDVNHLERMVSTILTMPRNHEYDKVILKIAKKKVDYNIYLMP